MQAAPLGSCLRDELPSRDAIFLRSDGAGGIIGRQYVHAGQLRVVREPAEIITVLGTCVAVCLWDPQRGVGGMNHYLLPHVLTGTVASPRFGSCAFATLVREVTASGGRRSHLLAKVFGGMQSRFRAGGDDDLGRANAALALSLLDEAGIPIVASDIGGERGRKLVFCIPAGQAFVQYL
jgi:chemotaxis protein CheD